MICQHWQVDIVKIGREPLVAPIALDVVQARHRELFDTQSTRYAGALMEISEDKGTARRNRELEVFGTSRTS